MVPQGADRPLRIAFAKGRGAAECAGLLEADGVGLPPEFLAGRLAIHRTAQLECYLLRGRDAPAMLAAGRVDVVFASSVVFEEHDRDGGLRHTDLEIGRCRLALLSRAPRPLESLTVVATRWPRLTAARLEALGLAPRLTVMEGCLESALFLEAADAVVDAVETGWTLRTLELHELAALGSAAHAAWVRPGDAVTSARLSAMLDQRYLIVETPTEQGSTHQQSPLD